jgi:hypothetical protein
MANMPNGARRQAWRQYSVANIESHEMNMAA